MVEYALGLVLVASVAAVGVGDIGNAVSGSLSTVAVAIGGPCTNYDARWEQHLAIRDEHKAAGTWKGAAHRDTRVEWKAIRDELKALGC